MKRKRAKMYKLSFSNTLQFGDRNSIMVLANIYTNYYKLSCFFGNTLAWVQKGFGFNAFWVWTIYQPTAEVAGLQKDLFSKQRSWGNDAMVIWPTKGGSHQKGKSLSLWLWSQSHNGSKIQMSPPLKKKTIFLRNGDFFDLEERLVCTCWPALCFYILLRPLYAVLKSANWIFTLFYGTLTFLTLCQ